MLTVADIATWLTGLGLDPTVPVVDGVYVPPVPNRIVLVQHAAGPGLMMEEIIDQVAIQIRSRGMPHPENPPLASADAQQLAGQVDDLILGTVPPVMAGATRIQARDRLGSGPRFQLFDTGFRAEWVCQYLLNVAR